ncbi:MAG: hypothetical protein NDI73_03855 [Desulfuromonadales bacterium]|nr:hypothetical protein [Desulfuromonadales bacterium]
MVVGFNHNFTYKGAVYHIQTEDSGRKSPTIVTLLYHGGTILASRKTSYADIAKVDNLEQVVEELMKEQHKGMLRSLKNGEFDDVIARYNQGVPAVPPTTPPATAQSAPPVAAAVHPAAPSAPPAAAAPPSSPAAPLPSPVAAATQPPPKPASVEASLDEIILSYLMGKEK